ncbi:MAG: hypothetical protein PVJ84_06850 [Desulfobacteraceae bacterium]
MSEIQHNQLTQFLKETVDQAFPGVYLIHGQQMLVEKSAAQLVTHLLDGESADMCCEKIEGTVENLADALERLNTFSLVSGPKIVLFKETKLFEGRRNLQHLVDQITEAWDSDDLHQSAKLFSNLCGRLEIPLEEVRHGSFENDNLKAVIAHLGSDGLDKLVPYCQTQGASAAVSDDHTHTLQHALVKGFPSNHFLIATVTSKVPKNLKLYKAFRKHGVVIDCNIPLGERRSDKAAQEEVLRQTLDELLSKRQKRVSPRAFQTLCRLTGFEPQIFVHNVEKLIDYVGEQPEITVDDIQTVLKRTRVDPVFELTNAVADRNLIRSLSHLDTLLDANWHPLQILSALANQMRKLLVAKSFTTSEYGKSWARGMTYPQFQRSVMPAIVAHDRQLNEQSAGWGEMVTDIPAKGRRSKKKPLEVTLAANPKSPYPVYQNMVKADKFTLQELVDAMAGLNQTDLRLKSTGQDAAMVLKKTIMGICSVEKP